MTKYPANDFTLIAAISQDTFTFSVPAESKYKTFKEIVEASKADPDKITLANAGTGALTHLASVAINQATGAQFRIVPFVGGAKSSRPFWEATWTPAFFPCLKSSDNRPRRKDPEPGCPESETDTEACPMSPRCQSWASKVREIPEGPWQASAPPRDSRMRSRAHPG